MISTQALQEIVERSGLQKKQIAEASGVKAPQINNSLAGKSVGSDLLARYADACGFSLALVPKDEVKFLSDSSILIDSAETAYAVEVLGADDGAVELGAFRTEKEAYSFLADYQSKHAGDFLRVVKREVPR